MPEENKEQIQHQKSPTFEEKDYEWKKEQELILKKWADKALCFKIMHERAYRRYWCLNAWFNIPVIILSTITGASNVASASFTITAPYIPYIIGTINIFAGILATISTYTGIAQKLESHRFSRISWDKFSRKVQIELAKTRKDRIRVKDFIKQAAEDYDRLIETSPILPNDIIRWFTNMIETGEFEEEIGNCGQCWFDCICFPCGCGYCKCFNILCCSCNICKDMKTPEKIEEDKTIKALWKLIELPEIVGRIRPTEIAVEQPEIVGRIRPTEIAVEQPRITVEPIVENHPPPPLIMIDMPKNDYILDNNSDDII